MINLSHTLIAALSLLYYIQPIYGYSSSAGKYPPPPRIATNSSSTHSIKTYNIPPPSSVDIDSFRDSKPFRFAKSIPVSISFPVQEELSPPPTFADESHQRWKVKVFSPGALSLSLIFDTWWIPEDAEVYIYNSQQVILGAFTATSSTSSSNSKHAHAFKTSPLQGDHLVIEYVAPLHVKHFPKIRISRIVYGYKHVPFLESRLPQQDSHDHEISTYQRIFSNKKRRQHSGKCNVDLSCDAAGMDWSNEARSVAVLLTDENQMYCTGVLLNNALHDGRQLLLTAYHCTKSSNLATDIVMFNHQRRTCNGYNKNKFTSYSDTLHGLKWLAGSPVSDFALLEIQEPIPSKYNVYLAGWSTVETPVPPFVGIHHPSGDYKKLSIYDGHLIPACWSECPLKGHWKVERWTRGTTEPGSSGSPLFDASHRVVGQLHGGRSSCRNLRGQDVYGSFNTSWRNNLGTFLDPKNQAMTTTGAIQIDGIYLNRIKSKKQRDLST